MSKKIISFIMLAISVVVLSFSFWAYSDNKTTYALDGDVITYSLSQDGEKWLSKNFQVKEFASEDGADKVLIDPELVVILQNIRDHFGKPLTITSGYRSPSFNASIGGASNSLHTYGMAADTSVSGVSPDEVAKYAETIGVRGIGKYDASNGYFVHLDTRSSKFYWRNHSVTQTSTHGGNFNSQPYAWPLLDQGVTNTGIILKKGDKNSSVKQLQYSLNTLINANLTVDGDFGAGTETAVKNFQTRYNLTADGIAGPSTIAKINDLIKNGGSSSGGSSGESSGGNSSGGSGGENTGGGSTGSEGYNVIGVTLNKTTMSLDIGETDYSLEATVAPSTATNKKVSWTSNNTAVATVDGYTGKIKAISTGTAIITAKTQDGDKTATCVVTVNCNHNIINREEIKATCIATGLQSHGFCDKCKCYFTFENAKISLDLLVIDVDSNAHEFVHFNSKKPTETESGWHEYDVCSVCGYSTFVEIPAKGNISKKDGEPTDTVDTTNDGAVSCASTVDGGVGGLLAVLSCGIALMVIKKKRV